MDDRRRSEHYSRSLGEPTGPLGGPNVSVTVCLAGCNETDGMEQNMSKQTLAWHDPNALVQTDWLATHLRDPELRVFDCTTHLRAPQPETKAPYQIVSGRADYDLAHIPGAGFLDLQG